jgi:hypothetical protein
LILNFIEILHDYVFLSFLSLYDSILISIFGKILKMKFKTILFAAAVSASSWLLHNKVVRRQEMLLVGDTYGNAVSSSVESKAITVDKLNKQLKKDNKKVENVAIKGKVTDVCDKRDAGLLFRRKTIQSFL